MTWEPTDKDLITATLDIEGFDNNGYAWNNGDYWATYGGVEFGLNPAKDPTSPMYDPTLPVFEPETRTGNVIEMPYQLRWYLGNSVEDLAYVDNDSWGAMLQWERDLSFANGVLLYGHRSLEEPNGYVATYEVMPFPAFDATGVSHVYLWGVPNEPPTKNAILQRSVSRFDSLELRLLSKETINTGNKYEWVGGIMGQNDDITDHSFGDVGAYNKWVNIKTIALGAFGQFAYQIFDDWNLSVGYRHSRDEKKYNGVYFPPVFYDAVPDGSGGYTRGPQLSASDDFPFRFPIMTASGEVFEGFKKVKAKWNKNTFKVNLNWSFAENAMTYVQYAKGYKTGNFTYDGGVIPPETMDSYELGFKTRFFDNRLQLNGTAYFYDYKNYTKWTTAYKCQRTFLEGAPFAGAYTNGICYSLSDTVNLQESDYVYNIPLAVSPGGAEQKGANVSIIWLLTLRDTFSFNGSWSDNEYKDYHVGEAILALYPDADSVLLDSNLQVSDDGVKFGGPPFNFNVGYTHTRFFGMDMLSFSTIAFYTGKDNDQNLLRSQPDLTYSMPGRPAYWTVDASITYDSSRWVPEGMNWSARLWVNNIFDKEYLTSLSYTDFNIYNPAVSRVGVATGSYGTPRTYGLTLSVNF
ncbi:MAG: TonB-dependent receptor [Desulfobacteraceae bacterium]|jgi:outer membrane receptor protein involved in Fe transport